VNAGRTVKAIGLTVIPVGQMRVRWYGNTCGHMACLVAASSFFLSTILAYSSFLPLYEYDNIRAGLPTYVSYYHPHPAPSRSLPCPHYATHNLTVGNTRPQQKKSASTLPIWFNYHSLIRSRKKQQNSNTTTQLTSQKIQERINRQTTQTNYSLRPTKKRLRCLWNLACNFIPSLLPV